MRIPLTSIIVEVPRLVAELTRAGVSILSLQTSRFHGNESVTLVVREKDAALAHEVIRAQSLGLEGKRPFDRQKEG